MVDNDKDEHGCINSAGYTWCELKNKCLRLLEEKCEIVDNEKWEIIFEGNGAPDCDLLKTTYLFPVDFLVGVCD